MFLVGKRIALEYLISHFNLKLEVPFDNLQNFGDLEFSMLVDSVEIDVVLMKQ
jgi:hypothetical protein